MQVKQLNFYIHIQYVPLKHQKYTVTTVIMSVVYWSYNPMVLGLNLSLELFLNFLFSFLLLKSFFIWQKGENVNNSILNIMVSLKT